MVSRAQKGRIDGLAVVSSYASRSPILIALQVSRLLPPVPPILRLEDRSGEAVFDFGTARGPLSQLGVRSMRLWRDLPTVWLYREPVDIWRSVDMLSALVWQKIGRHSCADTLYVFCNHRRDRLKVVYR